MNNTRWYKKLVLKQPLATWHNIWHLATQLYLLTRSPLRAFLANNRCKSIRTEKKYFFNYNFLTFIKFFSKHYIPKLCIFYYELTLFKSFVVEYSEHHRVIHKWRHAIWKKRFPPASTIFLMLSKNYCFLKIFEPLLA